MCLEFKYFLKSNQIQFKQISKAAVNIFDYLLVSMLIWQIFIVSLKK